jgi:hypothetical protein
MSSHSAQSVLHIRDVDPNSQWPSEPWVFFLRIRGILSTIATKVLISGAVWKFWGRFEFAAPVLVAMCGIVATLWAMRSCLISRIRIDEKLHSLFHATRDDVATMLSRKSQADAHSSILQFHAATANRIAEYFRVAVGDLDIGCAIRIADESAGSKTYVTLGRSSNLEDRSRSTVPLPAEKGLARLLRDKEQRGVLIVPDIKTAIENHVWEEQPNDNAHSVKSVMVCPVNSIEGGSQAMVGIVYITARKNSFRSHHTLALKAISDNFGLLYPVLHGTLPAWCVTQFSDQKKPPGTTRRRRKDNQ